MKYLDISDNDNTTELKSLLKKSFSSANINFLIGSGCSSEDIAMYGTIEKKIDEMTDEELKKQKIKEFKQAVINPHQDLSKLCALKSVKQYKKFLQSLSCVLEKRENSVSLRKANIFTTNYDLFIEEASNDIPIILNDGFERKPNLLNKFKYSTNAFFNRTYNNGRLYNYNAEIPTINLLKIHGSLSWKKENEDIVFSNEISEQFIGIMPNNNKHEETLTKECIYDLLRLYSNELDKENTILVSVGFSFEDSHIMKLTQRGLKNSTLGLFIVCCDSDAKKQYELKFKNFNNVILIYDSKSLKFGFEQFTSIFSGIVKGI